MSSVEPPVPPAGEELHLPGPSLQPLLLTVGITTAWWISAIAGVAALLVLVAWVRDARQELSDLPVHDDAH